MKTFINLSASQETILKHYLPDKSVIDNLTNLYSALSDSTRLKILISLCITPLCVGDLSLLLDINQTTISHQLKYLKQLNLVKCERNHKIITYSIQNNIVEKLLDIATDIV